MKAKIRFGYFFISLVFLLTFGTLFHNSTGAAGYSGPVEQEATPNGDWAAFWAGKGYFFTWEAYYQWTEMSGTEHSLLFTGSAHGCTQPAEVKIDSIQIRALFSARASNGMRIFLRETGDPAEWHTPFEPDITPVPTVYGITPVPTPTPWISGTSALPAEPSDSFAETASFDDLPPLASKVTIEQTLRIGGSANAPPSNPGDAFKCSGMCTYYHDIAVTFELNFETNKVTIPKVILVGEEIPSKISCSHAPDYVINGYCHRWPETMDIQEILEGKMAVSGDSVPIVVDLIPMNSSQRSEQCAEIE